MKNKKTILLCFSLVLICLLVIHLVYNAVDTRDHRRIRTQRVYHGDIETPLKKWLNGHLGVFFKFKYLGNINWLALPLLVWFLVDVRKRGGLRRWQGAVIFVWLLTTLLIAVKGYYNTRYQLTLFPFTTAMVLFLLWQLLEGKKNLSRILCFSFLGLICLYNIYHYVDRYKVFWEAKVSLKNPHFPYKLVDYLNANINDRSKVFTFNQPLFYYHTSKTGMDYENPYAVAALAEFKKKAGSRGKIYRLLKKWYQVDYILLAVNHQRFHRSTMLGEFLHCECKLVVEDHGRLLYRLRDKPLEEQLKSPAYREIKVWNSGASASASPSTVQEISPPLFRFYRYGLFKFNVSKNKGEKSIIVRNTGGKKDKKRRIHFGYEFKRRGLDVDPGSLAGRYVNFIVRAAISPGLVKADNYISVSDYKNKVWESQKVYFLSHHWRTYLVSKKVRPGVNRLLLMFRFCPRSPKDRLRIKDVKIVISEKPL